MGWMLAYGACCCCQRVFQFNPMRVPSTRAFTGKREPVCGSCFHKVNRKRRRMGLPAFPLQPGAYAPAPESEFDEARERWQP